MKSVSTSSIELTVATATMSAGLIVSLTYFTAESTARCTSSGCIELMSKSSTIRRRPASSSDVIGLGAAASACRAGLRPACARLSRDARLGAREQIDVVAPFGASEISSKVKLLTACGLPSSLTSKSAAVRPRTTRAGSVADDDVHRDDLGVAAEHRRLRRLLSLEQARGGGDQQPECRDSDRRGEDP